MNADVFIDTNILLYSTDESPASAPKRQRAEQLLLTEHWGWSVQVAAEFFVNATSAKRPFKLAAADAAALVEAWFAFPTWNSRPLSFDVLLVSSSAFDSATGIPQFSLPHSRWVVIRFSVKT